MFSIISLVLVIQHCYASNTFIPDPICSLSAVTGPCKALAYRYYFNRTTYTCELFNYGGCGGNKNNFATQAECEKRCAHLCDLPRKVGPCKAAFKRYYFDSKTGKCQQFIYGGCQGNANNFMTFQDCLSTCGGNSCNLRRNDGIVCNSLSENRYYYNKYTKKCQLFYFIGCNGNNNNYKTLLGCKSSCYTN